MTGPFPYRVVLVEDSPGDARLIRETLAEAPRRFELVGMCSRLSESFDCIERQRPAVVILDLALPDASGFEALEQIKRAFPTIPVVVLTGRESIPGDGTGEAAVEAGASDYLPKASIAPHVLCRVLRYAVARAKAEAAERARQAAEMELQSYRTEFDDDLRALSTITDRLRARQGGRVHGGGA